MRLVLGAAIAALAVSAGTALGMEVFGLEANPALSAALGAVAAATWAIAIGRRG